MSTAQEATVKTTTRRIETFKFKVDVTQADIENGECRMATRCMEKVAIARTLMTEFRGKSDAELRVRIDAGHIKFNLRGCRWIADTPKIAAHSLQKFDRKELVKPHSFVVVARKTATIKKVARDRQDQVNAARRARIRAGQPDKVYTRKTLRKRVVGFQ
jgi:hypothetical protein